MVLEGLGMPTASDSRPMKLAGPGVRHLKPATLAESSVCAEAGAEIISASPAVMNDKRCRCIDIRVGEWRAVNGISSQGGRARGREGGRIAIVRPSRPPAL